MNKYVRPCIKTVLSSDLIEYIGPKCVDYGLVTMQGTRQSAITNQYNNRQIVICKTINPKNTTFVNLG